MPSTTFLSNYQPYPFNLHKVNLNIDLYDDHALINNTMVFERTAAGDLYLHGEDLQCITIYLDNKLLDETQYQIIAGNLILSPAKDTFTLAITTKIYPQNNTELSGLYRTNDLFCTQCEAEGFRRITFFPDRPDVLSIYTTKITADKTRYPLLLSNGNCIDRQEQPSNRHSATWHDPFKKPAYLFALVAGDLACVTDEFITCSGKSVALHLYVEHSYANQCTHALVSLKKAMRWDEEQYGREYDLDLFMIVAVSDFNMGAMENKGLNIFNTKYILACKESATDIDYANIEGIVAHEYFHNWTGNRVTCRDWFQLSLKEGLTVFRDQEFSRDMNSRDVNRIDDVITLRRVQFPEDRGQMAHPVRPKSYQEISNFYTATIYNKGAEIIRMQETLLGKDGFRRGMDLYFQRHDGQAVTIDDFVAAMEDANNIDLTAFKLWYDKVGTPEVSVNENYHLGTLTLTFSQKTQPLVIPISVAFFYKNGQTISKAPTLIVLKEPQQTVTLENLTEKPIVSFLRDFSAPIQLHYQRPFHESLAILKFESNGFAAWDTAQQLALTAIHQAYQAAYTPWSIDSSLLQTYADLLIDESRDPALRAALLTPPGFNDLIAQLSSVAVNRLETSRNTFHKQLGVYVYERAYTLYQQLWAKESHLMHGEAYGLRSLRNVCLTLMMQTTKKEALIACQQQFLNAKTMTDQLKSLTLLANHTNAHVREEALNAFYQQWQHNPLVINKWFTVQATIAVINPLNTLRALLSHSNFSLKNPNNVYALIGAFTQQNPRHFHAIDGSGYQWLTECLLKLDPINPQVSARLAEPFTRWKTLNTKRQKIIQSCLTQLLQTNLSTDLREVVEKSLIRSY